MGVFDHENLVSYVNLNLLDEYWQVHMQCTDHVYRGQGYIRKCIEFSIDKYKCIMSDQAQTPEAQRTWSALITRPNLYHYSWFDRASNTRQKFQVQGDQISPDPWDESVDVVIFITVDPVLPLCAGRCCTEVIPGITREAGSASLETQPCERYMTMKQVRLVLVHDAYTEYEDHKAIMQEGISDWETISDEDHVLLQRNLWRLESQMNVQGARLVLLEKDTAPVKTRIDSIRDWIAQEKARAQQEAQKKREKAEARALKKLMQNAESEKKLLEELRKKYPDV